jgi:hypothetical protein
MELYKKDGMNKRNEQSTFETFPIYDRGEKGGRSTL